MCVPGGSVHPGAVAGDHAESGLQGPVSYTHLDVYKRQEEATEQAEAAAQAEEKPEKGTAAEAATEQETCLLYTSRCV